MPKTWERLDKRVLLSNPYYDISHDRYRRPDGEVGDYYYVDIPGSTMVIPEREDGRLLLVSQYRYLIGRDSLEFPAGGLPRDVAPLDNARRELREEIGRLADRWTRIGGFAPCNGLSNEICHIFLARQLSACSAAPEPTEAFGEVVALTPDELDARIASGEIWDGMTIAALALYRQWAR